MTLLQEQNRSPVIRIGPVKVEKCNSKFGLVMSHLNKEDV